VAAFAFSALANLVPFLANTKADTGQLRFVVLALALIVIMLLRPQGLMGHRELSLKKFFGQDPHAMGVKS
jgi:ABC-type branched-subunit amino acid transport system permease subunit